MPRSALLTPTTARAGRLPDVEPTHALRQQRFTPAKLAVLLDVAAQAGLDPAVLDGTGLTPAAVADPFTLTSPLQFLTAARNAIGGYDGTDLGVRVGHRLHVSSYGMYGYAMLSESLAHAFESAVNITGSRTACSRSAGSNTATSCRGSFPTGTKSRYRISTSRCTVS